LREVTAEPPSGIAVRLTLPFTVLSATVTALETTPASVSPSAVTKVAR
jgi:hypothetical protein